MDILSPFPMPACVVNDDGQVLVASRPFAALAAGEAFHRDVRSGFRSTDHPAEKCHSRSSAAADAAPGGEIAFGLSVGGVYLPEQANDTHDALARADDALRHTKLLGKPLLPRCRNPGGSCRCSALTRPHPRNRDTERSEDRAATR